MQDTVYYILVSLALLTVGLPRIGTFFLFPPALVLAKWIRWVLFSAIFAVLMETTGWSARPQWVHLIIGAGLWFLLETGYNWIVIGALSRSPLPLFPKFRENSDGDEWPAQARYIRLKDWLRENNYRNIAALKAELFEENYLRVSIYENRESGVRIQVLFIPKGNNTSSVFFSIHSIAADESRLITDNHTLPFGGFYPDNWLHLRKPLQGSLSSLHQLHCKRVAKIGFQSTNFSTSPLEELNSQQRHLENLNIHNGIIVPLSKQEEDGMLTEKGRYRIWVEMWLITYFGKAKSVCAPNA
ncbi:MAG: hypothetical protein ACON39_01530 [Coraliomargaritaceae bacterium]